jgi:hypothetical protein
VTAFLDIVQCSLVEADQRYRAAYCILRQGPDGGVHTSETSVYFYETKLKLSHYTPWRRLGKRKYSSYLFLTSALYGGEWSASRPGLALAPGKGPTVLIRQEAE